MSRRAAEGRAAEPPDGLRIFEQLMREAGHPVRSIWLDRGPMGMPIKLHALYRLAHSVVYVQGFLDGSWRAYTHDREDDPASISDVIARAAPAPPVAGGGVEPREKSFAPGQFRGR